MRFSYYICPVQNTNKTMNKETKKKTMYNEAFLIALNKKFGYSVDYIRKSLRGDATGIMPDKLKTAYKDLEKAENKIIENFIKN